MPTLPIVIVALVVVATVAWLRSRVKSSKGTLVVFGSGGHTAEMCVILHALRAAGSLRYEPLSFAAAETDRTSEATASANGTLVAGTRVHRLPRSREVGQPYASSVFSTAKAIIFSLALVLRLKPRLLLCNGPGTCLPLCIAAWCLSLIGLCHTRIAFVESVCRCKSLSMTGKILYTLGLATEVLVQWPELGQK